MPRSLAEGKTKVVLLPDLPADPENPTISELEAGIDASCAIVASTFNMGPQASQTVDEKALCEEGNVQAFGSSEYASEMDVFRYFMEEEDGGLPETGASQGEVGDAVFEMLKTKGTIVYAYMREINKKATEDFAEGEPLWGFKLAVDNPQRPTETTGYIKRHIVGLVQRAWLTAEVAGGSGGGEEGEG